jgi:hypothetical protein
MALPQRLERYALLCILKIVIALFTHVERLVETLVMVIVIPQ